MASNDNSKWDIDSTAPTAEVKGNLDTDEPETGWDENAVESQERVGTIAQWDAWETGKDTGLDEHCGIEQSTGKVLAATDADRSIVDEDAFETYYARQYERSAHLAVPSEDGTDWQEIAGMNESNKATHALHCSLVFDREQSYLEIKFTVRRDDATLYLSTHQHFSIRYYVNSITDLSYPRLTQVTSDSEIQPKLRNNIKAMRAFEQGSLWMLTLSHKESLCGRHGIFDTPTFSDPARLQDLETLRVAAQASEYDLFLILGSTSFAKTLETLKAKFKAESGKLPFAEYCSKRGNYVCEWGLEDFGRDKDTYERAPTNTFRSIKQWQLTHGYGVMRDCTVELDAVEKTLNNSMQASFIALDVPKDGLPQYYLALVQCNDELLIRKVYNVGDRGVLAWEEPYQGSEVPSGWSYTVKPPLPVADCPGNLVLLIKRRKEVTFAIPFSRMPHLNMEQQKVWAYPEVSDASPRRLVACTKLIAEKISGPAAQELKRYLLAKDLRERDPSSEMAQRAARIFPSRTDTNVSQKVKEVFQQFSESQGMAYDHLVDMAPAHAVILIQGPPGTSKTKFLSILFQIAWHTNSDGIGGASSNAGTDHLATTNNKTSPEMGSMRYHTWHGESRALQRYNDDTKTGHAIAEIPEDEFANIQDAEGAKAFNKFLVHISQNAPEWTVREKQRPNFTTMSLHVRSLQNTGVIEHDIPGFKRAEGEDQNKYAKFRQALLGKHFDGSAPASETGPDLQADYNAAETDLMRETMKISGAIFTTNHKMGDFELKNGKRPVWIGLEEGGESNEIESVIGWAHHVKTVALVVIVGDHKQLPPNVMTKSMNRENDLVNPFAPQMCVPLFTRLAQRGFPVFMFREQHRAVQGLCQIYNIQSYKGLIVDAPSTSISANEKGTAAVEFIEKNYNRKDGIPHLFLNVTGGICMKSEQTKSRANLHNVAACLKFLSKVLDPATKLFEENEITIVTPYRQQASHYRRVLRQTGRTQVAVSTIDAMQGQENLLVIIDLVVARFRTGGLGFVIELPRINVAFSRARQMRVIIGDDETLVQDRTMASGGVQIQDINIAGHLDFIFSYYNTQRMLYSQPANTLEDEESIDWEPVRAFEKEYLTCHNCDKRGHKANTCREPRVVTCRKCNQKGHTVKDCEVETVFYGTCRKCGAQGHRARACPEVTCFRCKGRHAVEDCKEPDNRECNRCGNKGHIARDCPKKSAASSLSGPRWRKPSRPDRGVKEEDLPIGEIQPKPERGMWASFKAMEAIPAAPRDAHEDIDKVLADFGEFNPEGMAAVMTEEGDDYEEPSSEVDHNERWL